MPQTNVNIPFKQLTALLLYAKHTDGEVGGLITGHVEGNDTITTTNVVLLPQLASSVSVSLDDEAIAIFLAKHPNEEIVGWWHSHGSMGPSFSNTDDETSERFVKGAGYCISIVVNQAGETKAAVYHRAHKFSVVFREDVKPSIIFEEEPNLEQAICAEIEEKVKQAPTLLTTTQGLYPIHDGEPFFPQTTKQRRKRALEIINSSDLSLEEKEEVITAINEGDDDEDDWDDWEDNILYGDNIASTTRGKQTCQQEQ